MSKYDEDKDGHLNQKETRSLLQGVLTGLGKDFDEQKLANYYDKYKMKDGTAGLDQYKLY